MPGALKPLNPLGKKVSFISNGLLYFSAIVFIAFYLVLSFYNRPTNEDVNFISIVKGKSIFEFVSWFYSTWCGRWMSSSYYHFILSTSSAYQNIHYVYFVYYVISLCILIYSLNSIIQSGIKQLFNTSINNKTSITYSILFAAGFYFSTFQNIEVWWWIFATVDHLQGIIILLLGIALVLKQRKSKIHYLLICLCFIYLGGSYEIYSLIFGALTLFSFIYLFYRKIISLSDFRSNYFVKRFGIAFILFFIALIVTVSAPGNLKRRKTYVRDHLLITSVSSTNTEFPLSGKEFAQKKYLIGLGLASLWILLGMKIRSNSSAYEKNKRFKKVLLFGCIPLLLSIIITYLFQILFLRYYSIPLRGWTFTSFSLFALFCLVFLIVGYQIRFQSLLLKSTIAVLLPFIISLSLLFYLFLQYNTTSLYARQYDNLIGSLIKAKKNKEIKVLYVDPLPDSGMFLPLEIGTDYIDDALKEILELKYDIVVKK